MPTKAAAGEGSQLRRSLTDGLKAAGHVLSRRAIAADSRKRLSRLSQEITDIGVWLRGLGARESIRYDNSL
jgi:hypothetical protein